jgi:polysaccharide pyruvyl transferase CsaB
MRSVGGGTRLARVVVSGYYGFGNAGDEVILAVLLRALRGHDVTVLSRSPRTTAAEHGVRAVPRAAPAAVLAALARCDLLVSGGGGLLQDATGPASVPYYLGVILLARALGKPVMVYAQGIGPLAAPWARRALRLLRSAAAITVRDAESAEWLKGAGVPAERIEVTADAALALPPPQRAPAGEPPPELAAVGLTRGQRAVALAPRPYGDTRFAAKLAAVADALQERLGARAVLVPMQLPEDVAACERVAAAMRRPAPVLRERPAPHRYAEVFAGFEVVVGMRLHALILAALAQAAPVGLSYDPKIDAFLEGLGTPRHGLPLDSDEDAVVAAALAAIESRQRDPARFATRVGELRAAAERNNEVLRRLLAACGG